MRKKNIEKKMKKSVGDIGDILRDINSVQLHEKKKDRAGLKKMLFILFLLFSPLIILLTVIILIEGYVNAGA